MIAAPWLVAVVLASPAHPLSGHWEGTISANGMTIPMAADFVREGDAWRGW